MRRSLLIFLTLILGLSFTSTAMAGFLDTAVEWTNGKIYFFRGEQYIRYDIKDDYADPGYPRKIIDNWRGIWDRGIDAVFVRPDNGKAYFFKGDLYIRYNIRADRADPGYPKPIKENWPGVKSWLDAAVALSNGKIYFFNGDEYTRFDTKADRADPGYPRKIIDNWRGIWDRDIDAVIYDPNKGKLYFFKGDEYIRYDIRADRADPGYPKPIKGNWRKLDWSGTDTTIGPGGHHEDADYVSEFTVDQAAEYMKVSRETVLSLIANGKLKARKDGDTYFIKRADIDSMTSRGQIVTISPGGTHVDVDYVSEFTIDQAADYMQVSQETVLSLIANGKLKARKVDIYLIKKADIDSMTSRGQNVTVLSDFSHEDPNYVSEFTVDLAAVYMQVSQETILSLIANGRLKARKVEIYLINKADIDSMTSWGLIAARPDSIILSPGQTRVSTVSWTVGGIPTAQLWVKEYNYNIPVNQQPPERILADGATGTYSLRVESNHAYYLSLYAGQEHKILLAEKEVGGVVIIPPIKKHEPDHLEHPH